MNSRIVTALGMAVLAAVLAPPDSARAAWYSENIESGSDIIMMDLRWPWWPSGTYFANWNTGFNPKPNNLSFYAGIQSWLADGPGERPHPEAELQQAFRPGNTWSLWGNNAAGVPPRFLDVGPTQSMVNAYGGEGTSAYLAAIPWPFIKNERWYTMLGRVWQPPGGGDHAYCGRWIKDHADGRWHLVGVAWLPSPATSFQGNSGFIEPLCSPNAVRSLHRRLGYLRKDGVWKKADTISITKTVYVVVNVLPEGDHEYAAMEYAQRPDLMPLRLTGPILDGNKKYDFKTQQPDLPVLDQQAVAKAAAVTTGSQIGVSWEVPATASPALGYRIEVFDNPQCSGSPVAVREERMPSTRHALLDIASASPTVRLTVTDIFDQTTVPLVIKPVPAAKAIAPQPITPPPWGEDTVSYPRYVQPVLEQYCGKCHTGDHEAVKAFDITPRPGFLGFAEPYHVMTGRPSWGAPYQQPENPPPGWGIAGMLMVEGYGKTDPAAYRAPPPMIALSYRSRLIELCSSGKHYDVKVDPVSLQRLIAWVDAMCPYNGDEEVRMIDDPVFQGVDWLSIRPRIKTAPTILRPGPVD